jgi:hypothetical protein
MRSYYFDFEGGGEVPIFAASEEDAWEQCRKMYPNQRVIKVWHA